MASGGKECSDEEVQNKVPHISLENCSNISIGGDVIVNKGKNTEPVQPTPPQDENKHFPSYAQIVKRSASSNIEGAAKQRGSRNNQKASHVGSSDEEKWDIPTFIQIMEKYKSGHFILITGKITDTSNTESIPLIPWLCIYDFDVTSRDNGLLSVLEAPMKKIRGLHMCTLQDDQEKLSEVSTCWCLARGMRERPDTRTPDDPQKWSKAVRCDLNSHLQQLAKFVQSYTTLTLVVMWPQRESDVNFVRKLLEKLIETVEPPPYIVMCLCSEKPAKENIFDMVCDDNEDNITKLKIDASAISIAAKTIFEDPTSIRKNFLLPVAGHVTKTISRENINWLNEEIDVLYCRDSSDKSDIDIDKLHNEAELFYRGGTLPWFVWYACESDHLDVERDITKKMVDNLSRLHINVNHTKSLIIVLNHAPGSGGTTIGKRILWEMKTKIPCTQVKFKTWANISDLIHRISFLYENTRLPVLVLVDGEEEQKVQQLYNCLKEKCIVIFLYVKRFPYSMDKKTEMDNIYWLPGQVSATEAIKLGIKYEERCNSEKKKNAVRKLTKDVQSGEDHCVYEFGLATFLHDYEGITSYVRGYLNLQDNIQHNLMPWQKILGYLSLAYYYGHVSIPIQFFGALLEKAASQSITLDHFPHAVREFIIVEPSDGRQRMIRICHYIIAQEILEHVLQWPREKEKGNNEKKDFLSKRARCHLHQFAIEFIEEVGKKMSRNCKSQTLINILARTFIFRDSPNDGDEMSTRKTKPQLSRMLMDIECVPPYTERLQVLEKLTKAVPEEPNFHAHLGRFVSLFRADEEKTVDACFIKALKLCNNLKPEKESIDVDERMKLTLMHIYHMYGTVFMRRIGVFTGRFLGDRRRTSTSRDDFQTRSRELLKYVETACTFFQKCREVTPVGNGIDYGFVGEINVRLQLCDFICRSFDGEIHDYLRSTSDELTDFLTESICVIDELFLECYSALDPDDNDRTLMNCIAWYVALFKKSATGITTRRRPDDMHSRRLTIAAMKLKYSKNTSLGVLETITCKTEVEEIVSLYEKNFKDYHDYGIECRKTALEMDYMEWIFAIRHEKFPRNYSVEDVLLHVRRWSETICSPWSRYYHFIMTCLLGFGSTETTGSSEMLVEANRLKDELTRFSKWGVNKPRYPREWLGVNSDIRRIVSSFRFFGRPKGTRIPRSSGDIFSQLQKMMGTICRPNDKPPKGFIDLDLGNNPIPVKVFFMPMHSSLNGPQYAGERVEFVLAFSMSYGYEAFDVVALK